MLVVWVRGRGYRTLAWPASGSHERFWSWNVAQGQGGRSRINLEELVGQSDGPGAGSWEPGGEGEVTE